jgi:3-oxoacyl-[acyl-carrier-protein] synthase-1
MSNRVVVTGIGIWSCLGKNIEEVKESLFAGRSGIIFDQERLDYGYHSGLTGNVERPNLKKALDRRIRMGMSEESEYAYVASKEAFDMAKIDEAYLNSNEVGVIFGNDSSAKAVIECQEIIDRTHDSELIGSGNIFQSMNSTVNMNMSTIFRLRGINFSVSAACASGSHSIGLAYMFIKQGLQDVILCGGAQEVNKYAMVSFDALGVFSKRMDEPQKASRPFDRDRDGLVPSGGAAALVLESYEHAVARGATIIAEICGYGFSSNGNGINQPSDEGSYVAMSRALKDAALLPEDIDYVNAHATSTPQGDMNEAIALTRLFSTHNTPVSSTKSMTGHECWMAGASEAVYSIIMMQNGFIAPNINFENPDEYSEKLNIVSATQQKQLNIVMSNSFGFGGTNSAIVIRK